MEDQLLYLQILLP